MRRTLWTLTGLIVLWLSSSVCQETTAPAGQKTFMVWDASDQKNCPLTVTVGSGTRLEAPMKDDGTPDMKQAVLKGLWVQHVAKCGRYEVRK